jgi:hypothetical protein
MNKQEWDNSLMEHFAPKEGGLNLDLIMEMVAEVMDTIQDLPASHAGYVLTEDSDESEEEGTDNVKTIRRPIIKISELWGKPGEDDRDIMEEMMKGIVGGTLEEKIRGVNDFLADPAPAAGEGDISKIMSYLIFLDTFASIISDYGASVTGFLFEAFLAALFGGTSIQVDDPEQVGAKGSLPIEDNQLLVQLRDPDGVVNSSIVPYSLKVLRQDGTVHGSFKNLVDFFLDPATKRKTDSITYLIVIKEAPKKGSKLGEWTGKLKFYEFNITRKNFLDLIGAPTTIPVYGYVLKKVSDIYKRPITVNPEKNTYSQKERVALRGMIKFKLPDGSEITEPTRFEVEDEILHYSGTGETQDVIQGSAAKLYSPEQYERVKGQLSAADDITRQVFATLKDTKGYGSKEAGGAQWSIPPGVYRNLPGSYKGTIDLDQDLLRSRAEEYTQSLNAGIVDIFNAVGDLTDNINSYFISGKKPSGQEAIKNAAILRDTVNKVIPTEAIEQKASE